MNPVLLAQLIALIGPAIDAFGKLKDLFTQEGGPTDDQLRALIADVQAKNAIIQGG